MFKIQSGNSIHCALLGTASALAMGAFALSTPAFGQAAPGTTAQSATPIETVVVTGIRASLKSAQAIKKNATQIVDSISPVDINALPDRNVAEALQRVPGVTLQRTDANRDPVRYGGTGNTVFVRGLAWVQSLTNGRDTFSALNGRTLSWADVSASLLGGVDVYKNPNATMIEGGVGGVVDLKTRKPFDQDGRLIAASADYTEGDLINKGTPSASALFSDRWNTHLGEIGFLISVDYQDQKNRTNGVATSHYDCVDKVTGSLVNNSVGVPLYGSPECQATAAGDGVVYLPNILGWRQIDWEQQRSAVDGSLQWRPDNAWEFTFEGFYSKARPKDVEHTLPFNIRQDVQNEPGYTYDRQGVWTGGVLTQGQTGGVDTRIGSHDNTTADFSLNAKFEPSSHWSFRGDIQHIESEATNYSMTGFSDLGNPADGQTNFVPAEDVTMNLAGNTPTVTVSDPAAMMDPHNYYYAAAMDHLEWNSAHSWAYRADGTYSFDDNAWLKSVDFGYRGEDRSSIGRQTGYNWSLLSHENWGGGPPVFLDADLGAKSAQKFGYGSFFGGNIPGGWFLSPDLLNKSTTYAYSILHQTETNGWGWTPYSVQSGCATAGQVISQDAETHCFANYTNAGQSGDAIRGINGQNEKTNAGYAQLNFAHEGLFGWDIPIDGNLGLRAVHTDESATAGKMFLPTFTLPVCDPVKSGDNCAAFEQAVKFSNNGAGGAFDLPGVSQSYTDYLPSFNIRFGLSDELQSRVALSQSMVRPDFAYTVNQATLTYTFCSDPSCTGELLATGGNAGNPKLKPLKSTNYDWTLEWYFAPAGSLTFDAFYKDLSDYWITEALPATFTNNGVTQTFNVNTYVNGRSGTVGGFELAYQQFYDWLPGALGGLGLQANYTKLWNSGGANISQNPFDNQQGGNSHAALPLEGMSDDSYNLALLYAKYDVDARLAYNWRSRFLLTSSAANVNQPIWSEAYGQLDGSIFYSFMDHYKIGLEATNLLAPKTILDVGYTDFHPRYDWIETDRKVSIVLRAQW